MVIQITKKGPFIKNLSFELLVFTVYLNFQEDLLQGVYR